MKYALKVYYLIPLAALLFSNQFHQKFFILKDFFLILMLPVLITGILYRIFVKAENSNEIVITVSDFLIISAFALVTLHYFSLKKYLDTIISFHHMQFLLLLFISIKFIPFELKSDNGKIVFVLSGIIISVITIVEKINYPGSRLLYQSTFGNPSYSSGFLLLLFPVMMSLTNKVLKNIIVIIASIAIIILGSRVAIVILCFQFFVLLRGKRKQAVFFVIAIITLFMIFNSNRMKLNSKSFRRNMVYRVEVLKTSVKMLPDSIILGRGNSYAKYNFHKYYEKLRNRKVSYLNTYYLHCDPLEFIIEYGWLFFVICLFVLLLCIKTPEFITVSVISLIMYSMFSFPLRLSGIYPLFMLFVFYLSGKSNLLISFNPLNWHNRIIVIMIIVLFSINFVIGIKFFSRYLNCDMALKEFNSQKYNPERFDKLKKSFLKMPYYYDLAYRYGIACMKNGKFNEALKVLIYVKELRDERTVNINIEKVISKLNNPDE